MAKRILIADDHMAVRTGIRDMLSAEYAAVDFGEALNSEDIFQKLKDENWDILILDIDLPGRSGLDVLRQINTEGIRVPVLIFSFHKEERIAELAMKLGASGYVVKDAADTELVGAVNEILAG